MNLLQLCWHWDNINHTKWLRLFPPLGLPQPIWTSFISNCTTFNLFFFSYWRRWQNIVFRSATASARDNERITHDQRKQAATVWRWMYNWSFATLCVINPLDSYYSLHNGFHLSWETLGKLAAWRLAQKVSLFQGKKKICQQLLLFNKKEKKKSTFFHVIFFFYVCCICILTLRNVNSVALNIWTDLVWFTLYALCVTL